MELRPSFCDMYMSRLRETDMDWRETMQRMLARLDEIDGSTAIRAEARAVLEASNDETRSPAAYLWGGILWRADEMARGRPGAVELYPGDALAEPGAI